MKIEQEIIRSVFDAYIRDIKAINEKHEPTIDMLEEVKNRAIKALGQNTVSEEVYNDEYIARKQAEQKLYEIEQNTSDDCVSRQAVLKLLESYVDEESLNDGLNDICYEFVSEKIKKVPSVTPKLPTSEDCISRAEVQKFVSYIQSIKDSHNEQDTSINYGTICDLVIRGWKLMELPSVTPTRKVPREDITEDEVRINMLELALNQAKEHAESIEVLTDNHRLIFKAEMRNTEND